MIVRTTKIDLILAMLSTYNSDIQKKANSRVFKGMIFFEGKQSKTVFMIETVLKNFK